LSDGVTGNTLDFDSRKSRFEPWSDNDKAHPIAKGAGLLRNEEVSAFRFLPFFVMLNNAKCLLPTTDWQSRRLAALSGKIMLCLPQSDVLFCPKPSAVKLLIGFAPLNLTE
jgi:hypothetical protein